MALDSKALVQHSWLRFGDLPPASSQTEATFAVTREAIGYVRNRQRILAHKPNVLTTVSALGDAIVRDTGGTLSPKERELIALVVSAENRCEACVFANGAALRGHSGAPEWVATNRGE